MAGGFEDLEVYRAGREFRKRVWKLTRLLPEEERYVLVPQMRKAALSVTNCIAEGHGSRGFRHNVSYLLRSRGSMCELQDDINVCEDEGYFEKEHLDDLRAHSVTVMKLLNGYIRHVEGRLEANRRSSKRRRPS